MRKTIFLKIAFILLLFSVIPAAFFNFLVVLSYNGLIKDYQKLIEESGIQVKNYQVVSLTEFRNEVVFQVLLTLFLILILLAFALGIFYRTLVSPLQALEKAFKKVAKGNLYIKLKTKRSDEIGSLIKSFNKMVEDLKVAKDALEEEKLSLEIKVKARTKALEEAKQLLEQKVEERTKELKERIEELEKFHRLTVGRELKMIELKKEIARLKQQIKELEEKKEV